MANAPKISVVMAAYNAEATIAEALESLAAQTYRDLEIVVVDDGSKDGTCDIVRAFRPEGIEVRLYSQVNAGPSAARNHGIAEAKAPLIAFMDADDIALPWRFEHSLEVLERYPDAGAVLCEITLDAGTVPESMEFSSDKIEELSLLDFAASDNLGGTSAAITRADALRSVGGFDPRLWNGEDYELWTRLVARYQVVRYHNPVLRVRAEVGGLSTSYERCLPQVNTLMFKVFGKNGVFADYREYSRVLKAHQFDHLSWMAFREGHRLTALRLLGTSLFNHALGRLRVPKAAYPSGQLPLLARYLVGTPPGPGEL